MDKRRRELWTQLTNRANWVPSKYAALCSDHFRKDDFEVTCEYSKVHRLKKSAIPFHSFWKNSKAVLEEKLERSSCELEKASTSGSSLLHDHNYCRREKPPAPNPSAVVYLDHDYCYPEVHVVNARLQLALTENEKLRKKLKALQKKHSKAKLKCQSLKQMVLQLKRTGND